MRHRRPARLLAPLALVAAALAVLLVVQSDRKSSTSSTPAAAPSTRSTTVSSTTATTAAKPRSYTIKAGDTLSGIAATTGVGLARIEALNPGVDAAALRTGQKLKLAP